MLDLKTKDLRRLRDQRYLALRSGDVLDFRQPLQIGLEYVPLQRQVGELAVADNFNQPCRLQLFQMMGKRRGADVV